MSTPLSITIGATLRKKIQWQAGGMPVVLTGASATELELIS